MRGPMTGSGVIRRPGLPAALADMKARRWSDVMADYAFGSNPPYTPIRFSKNTLDAIASSGFFA